MAYHGGTPVHGYGLEHRRMSSVVTLSAGTLVEDELTVSQDVRHTPDWDTRTNKRYRRDHGPICGTTAAEAMQVHDPLWKPMWDQDGTHTEYSTELDSQGWNILSKLCDGGGGFNQAIKVVDTMEKQGMLVSSIVFSRLLQQCTKDQNLAAGRQVHYLIVGSGCEADVFLGSCLVHMFALCGSLPDANQGFSKLCKRNVYSWTAIIEAYVKFGQNKQAIQMYHEMEGLSMKPDGHVFVAVLKACCSSPTLEHGKEIHTCIMENGLDLNVFVGSALINMYAKCGSLNEAYLVFDRLSNKNVITWSALIAGYVEHGHGQDALLLFQQMEREGIDPNEITYLCLLKACSSLAALENGKHVHFHIIERGFESDLFVGNALIDMYSKCGSLNDALVVFNRMPQQDVVTWSVLVAGYAKHSDYQSAVHFFHNMQKLRIRPNGVTYLSLISACSHMGLVKEGCLHFKYMTESDGVLPTLEHYNVLVDLLGRAGYLDEAEDLLQTLPFGLDYVGWVSLLDSCRLSGDVHRGRRCFDNIVTIEGQSALGYVLMSNIYAHAGLWEDVKKLEELRKCANLWKKPAKAFIEINNHVHDFIVDDISHPQAGEIYAKLKTLNSQIREEGYVPQLDFVMESDDKEDALCGHCEKLAIAFGLISTPQGTTIRVAKNLRVCKDCHSFVKIISRIELREIIVTDAYCIHHFKDGACCCRDEYT